MPGHRTRCSARACPGIYGTTNWLGVCDGCVGATPDTAHHGMSSTHFDDDFGVALIHDTSPLEFIE